MVQNDDFCLWTNRNNYGKVENAGYKISTFDIVSKTLINTLQYNLQRPPKDVMKVVSFSRLSLNAGCIGLIYEGVLDQNSGVSPASIAK